MNKKYKIIKRDVLAYCNDVDADLDTIVSIVEYEFPNFSITEVKNYTLEIIEKLLFENLIEVGNINKKGEFSKWNLNLKEIINIINREWHDLEKKRELLPGDIAWFIIKNKGTKELEYLNNLLELQETDTFYNE